MTYAAQLALEEGFSANGAEFVTLPVLGFAPSTSPGSWLSRARDLLSGQKFDQIWINLVHCAYDDEFLLWLTTLAPVRIGFVMESLNYSNEECALMPHLSTRRAKVEAQMRTLTHVLVFDELDAEEINAQGLIKALWWPSAVPARVISKAWAKGCNLPAVFHGNPYGEREALIRHPKLSGLLAHGRAPEDLTELPKRLEMLQKTTFDLLANGTDYDTQALANYVAALRQLRREIFDCWMGGLSHASAQVNLPHFLKAYSSRVVESMAAGCPVISWDIPRSRNRALFTHGEEILLFDRANPADLAKHIRRLQHQPDWGRELAKRAQAKIADFHTIEKRVQQVLDWVATERQPNYGETKEVGSAGTACCLPNSDVKATSVDSLHGRLSDKEPRVSKPHPNDDENECWRVIEQLLRKALGGARSSASESPRILELGCGRGWRTHLISKHGLVEGVCSVAEDLEQAQEFFPRIQFTLGNANSVLCRDDFRPYDLVLCIQLIENVPNLERPAFVSQLVSLLKPGGHLIIAERRGEVFEDYSKISDNSLTPPGNWIAEQALRELLSEQNLGVIAHERVFFERTLCRCISEEQVHDYLHLTALYQLWLFQAPVATTSSSEANRPELCLDSLLQRADGQMQANDFAGLLATTSQLLHLLPDSPDLRVTHAFAQLQLGNNELARQELVICNSLYPKHMMGHQNLAEMLRAKGLALDAEMALRRALALESNNADIQKQLADTMFSRGQYLKAGRIYALMLTQKPRDVATLLRLCECCLEIGEIASAKSALEKIIEISPDHQFARAGLEQLERASSRLKSVG